MTWSFSGYDGHRYSRSSTRHSWFWDPAAYPWNQSPNLMAKTMKKNLFIPIHYSCWSCWSNDCSHGEAPTKTMVNHPPIIPFCWVNWKKNLPIIINHPPLSQVEPKCLSKCLLLGPCLSSCPAKLREAIPCHSANVKAINTENQMINPVFGRCALYQRYKPLWRVCVWVSVYISFR